MCSIILTFKFLFRLASKILKICCMFNLANNNVKDQKIVNNTSLC